MFDKESVDDVDYAYVLRSEPVLQHQAIEAKAADVSKSEIDSALSKYSTWVRSVTDESRREVLRDVIRKFTSAGAVHAELTDDDVTRGIKEAYAAAVDKLQAAEEDGAESPTFAIRQRFRCPMRAGRTYDKTSE